MTTAQADSTKRRAVGPRGFSVYTIARNKQGHVSLPEALRVLAREGIAHLLVEGGGRLNAGFFETGLVDEAVWFIAPKILGGETARTAVEGAGVADLARAWSLKNIKVTTAGPD